MAIDRSTDVVSVSYSAIAQEWALARPWSKRLKAG